VPNFSEPVTFTFIIQSIAAIFALIAAGIILVKKFK
jgi:flagellar biogenesis protein FliO